MIRCRPASQSPSWRTSFAIVLLFASGTALTSWGSEPEDIPPPCGRPDYCGIWGIWGGETVSREGRPWYKGTVVTANWRRVEPRPGEYSWDGFDARVRRAAENGLAVMILVYHGDACPDWIFDHGVPRVETDSPKAGRRIHPYYLDPDYKPLLVRLIRATAEHVASYPPEIRNRIVGVQCPTGKSGDPQAYNGVPLERQYRINSSDAPWVNWTIDMFQVYHEAYEQVDLPVFLLFKGPPEANDWLPENIPDTWRKPHAIAQGYQFNREWDVVHQLYPYTRQRIDGVLIRTRGELDNTTRRGKNWFNTAPIWNVYWSGLWNLTYGIDIWNQLTPILENARFVPAFEFVSRYAGYKSPMESPGAWIALRDGLDCADTDRFPESEYGELGDRKPWQVCGNRERYLKIVESFSDFGARLDDLEHVDANGLDLRRYGTDLNDVGFRIWPGNYGMFLTQHDPNGTSQGYWRVGSKDQPYGRFARGFHHASGKDAMYFRFDKGFFADGPEMRKEPITVRVVYFDQGHGRWTLQYDAVGDPKKTAIELQKTDSGRWLEVIVDIDDGRFARRGPNQSDLMLVNLDEEYDVFHMIELRRRD